MVKEEQKQNGQREGETRLKSVDVIERRDPAGSVLPATLLPRDRHRAGRKYSTVCIILI
jgi:hypothetical protein